MKIIFFLFCIGLIFQNCSHKIDNLEDNELIKLQNKIILSNSYSDIINSYSDFKITKSQYRPFIKSGAYVIGHSEESCYVILPEFGCGVSIMRTSEYLKLNPNIIYFEGNSSKLKTFIVTKNNIIELNNVTKTPELNYLVSVVNDIIVVYDYFMNEYIVIDSSLYIKN